MIKKTHIIGLLVLAILLMVIFKIIYKDHRDIAVEKPIYEMTSSDLVMQFSQSLEKANDKFLDKIIIVHGIITEISSNSVVLDSQIRCYIKDSLTYIIPNNSKVQIKGRCIGYDELLDEIKLDQCLLLTN